MIERGESKRIGRALAVAAVLLLALACPGEAGARTAPQPVATVAATAPAAEGGVPSQPPARFVDRFTLAPELAPRWIASDGWNSGEWFSTEWRRSQIAFNRRGAVFTLQPSGPGAEKPYMSGEIRSTDEYRYGYFEARLRMPRGNGLVSAFFTFTRSGPIETRHEIDMELTGYDPRRIELVYHVGDQATLQVVQLPFDASAGMHTYAFSWRPNSIRWYIDNRLVHVSRGGRVAELTRPQRMFASLWNSERMPRWLGRIDPAQAPWVMTVSCIAYAPRYEGRSLCAD